MGEVKILTPKEVREILRISEGKMRELLHSNDFPKFTIGRRYYVNQQKLIEWINRQ